MENKFCIGICPYCEGNGLLFVVKDLKSNQLRISCDECYQEFLTPEDVKERKSFLSLDANDFVGLDEIVAYDWAEYVYTFENGKWLKYTDKTKCLF